MNELGARNAALSGRGRLVPGPRPQEVKSESLRLVFGIANYPHLLAAYGPGFPRAAYDAMHRAVLEACGFKGLVVPHHDGRIGAIVQNDGLPGHAKFLRTMRAALIRMPVSIQGETVHLAVSAASLPHIPGRTRIAPKEFAALDSVPFAGEPARTDAASIDRYRGDMALVATLFAAIAEDRVHFAWQPVCAGLGDENVLYCEALLRGVDAQGAQLLPGHFIPVLERLGLIRVLDEYVVSRVLHELEMNPRITLGVNISSQSAVFDDWWGAALARLRAQPDIARRLVIEITETARIGSMEEAAHFAEQMRAMGCRIALDDFGAGHASIQQLLALQPDIVKVDRFFLSRASGSDNYLETYQHLVGLARTLAPTVVAEGVETEAEHGLAKAAGAAWQQGYLLGVPTPLRSWSRAPVGPGEAAELYRAAMEASARLPAGKQGKLA